MLNSNQQSFDKFYNYRFDNESPDLIEVKFEPRNLYFSNGKLKYCPNLLSPCHNFMDVPLSTHNK